MTIRSEGLSRVGGRGIQCLMGMETVRYRARREVVVMTGI